MQAVVVGDDHASVFSKNHLETLVAIRSFLEEVAPT
jgi:hypothetical protein